MIFFGLIGGCAGAPKRIVVPLGSPCAAISGAVPELRAAASRAERWIPVVPYRADFVYESGDGDSEALPDARGEERAAVVSFPEPTGDPDVDRWLVPPARSFVYDDALVAIALLQRGDAPRARGILLTLEALLSPDGSIGFSFNTRDDGFYNRGYVRNGAVAWVGYALASYERNTGDRRFRAAALRVAHGLLAQRVRGDDPRSGLITGGRGLWTRDNSTFEPDFVLHTAITEHQLDAWFLLDLLAATTGDADLRAAADALAAAIEERLWLPDEGRFAVAATADGVVRDEALDAAGSWSALFLLARGRTEPVKRLLALIDRRFGVWSGAVRGHRPYAGQIDDYADVPWATLPLIWPEGSLGVALALYRAGDREGALELLVSAARLQCATGRGGLPVSTFALRDFPAGPGVAPTAWFLIVADEVLGGGERGLWSRDYAR